MKHGICIALPIRAPVALLQRCRLPRQVTVDDHASVALQVHAFVGDRIGNHHVVAALLGKAARDALSRNRVFGLHAV